MNLAASFIFGSVLDDLNDLNNIAPEHGNMNQSSEVLQSSTQLVPADSLSRSPVSINWTNNLF